MPYIPKWPLDTYASTPSTPLPTDRLNGRLKGNLRPVKIQPINPHLRKELLLVHQRPAGCRRHRRKRLVAARDDAKIDRLVQGHGGVEAEVVPARKERNVRRQQEGGVGTGKQGRVRRRGQGGDGQGGEGEGVVAPLGGVRRGHGARGRELEEGQHTRAVRLNAEAVGRGVGEGGRGGGGRPVGGAVRGQVGGGGVVEDDVRDGRDGAVEVLRGHGGVQRLEDGREFHRRQIAAPLLVGERGDAGPPGVVGLGIDGGIGAVVVPQRDNGAQHKGAGRRWVVGRIALVKDVGPPGRGVGRRPVEGLDQVDGVQVAARRRPLVDDVEVVVGVDDRVVVEDVVGVRVVLKILPVLHRHVLVDVLVRCVVHGRERAPDPDGLARRRANVRRHRVHKRVVVRRRARVLVRPDGHRLGVEPRQELAPDGLHGRNRVRVADVEQRQVRREAQLRLPLHNHQRVAGRLDLGNHGDPARGTRSLHAVELVARVRLVPVLVEPRQRRGVGPQPEPRVEAQRALARVDGHVVVQVVAQVQVQRVLLKEGHVRAQLAQERRRVKVAPCVEHHAACRPAGRVGAGAQRKGTAGVKGRLLQDGARRPPCAERAGTGDGDARGGDGERVALGRGVPRGIEIGVGVTESEEDAVGQGATAGSVGDSGVDGEDAAQILGECRGEFKQCGWDQRVHGVVHCRGILAVDHNGLNLGQCIRPVGRLIRKSRYADKVAGNKSWRGLVSGES